MMVEPSEKAWNTVLEQLLLGISALTTEPKCTLKKKLLFNLTICLKIVKIVNFIYIYIYFFFYHQKKKKSKKANSERQSKMVIARG